MNLYQRWLNYRGRRFGYGTCPNCGNSWWGRASNTVWYSRNSGMLICSSCYTHPYRLDEKRIQQALLDSGWEWAASFQAILAVMDYRDLGLNFPLDSRDSAANLSA